VRLRAAGRVRSRINKIGLGLAVGVAPVAAAAIRVKRKICKPKRSLFGIVDAQISCTRVSLPAILNIPESGGCDRDRDWASL
jgi:hypothetical protein